ncbi:DUF2846 domain-containing protein [Neisseria wadsworthii]|uniref:DUF2846 domain-containing protein n=1 Tax=Neisseria wadsworthii TaxID=607711 RepID=UPI000D30697C|nr:DUF2846 domain-containing protein [Neisseria wadsworthii]
MKKYLFVCMLFPLALTACQSKSPRFVHLEQPEYNHGKLYIYRPHNYKNAKVVYEVYAGDIKIGHIHNGHHIHKDLPFGIHKVHLKNAQASLNVPLRIDEIKCLRLTFNEQQPVLQKMLHEQCKVDILSTKSSIVKQ